MDSKTETYATTSLVISIDLKQTHDRLMDELKTLAAAYALSRFERPEESPDPPQVRRLAIRVFAIREMAKDVGVKLF